MSTKEHRTRTREPFRFGLWLRLHGPDIITLALAGAMGLGIYFAPPAYNRYFAVQFQDGEVVYPAFAVPMQKDLVPIWLAAFIAFIAPFATFCIFQSRRRSIEDLLTTTLGLLRSLVTAALFQVFIKCLIGGLRPHFLEVCNPKVPAGMVGTGFSQLYFQRDICQGDKKAVNDAVESMPSGHSTAAFAGLIFLSLYLNAQLKLISAHNPAYWKMLLFMAPILGACLIAGSMTIDGFHHWYDVFAGGVIGTLNAFVAFRMTFASIWDFRFNHLLLPRTTSIFLRTPASGSNIAPSFPYTLTGMTSPSQWPFTREGGWGSGTEQGVGAPFDASAGMGAATSWGNNHTHGTSRLRNGGTDDNV